MSDGNRISILPEAPDSQITDPALINIAVVDATSSTGFTSKKSPLSKLAEYIKNKLQIGNKADLYNGTSLTNSNDLNTVKTVGNYRISNASSIPKNAPENSRGRMYVYDGMLSGDPNTLFQKYITYPSGVVYTRYYKSSASSWTAWEKQPTRAEMDALNSNLMHADRGTIAITSGQNLNDFVTVGTYYCSSATVAASLVNCPLANSGFKLVVEAVGYPDRFFVQTIYVHSAVNAEMIYKRAQSSPTERTWYEWQMMPTRAEMDALNSSTKLTLTRTENQFVDSTSFNRLYAYKSGNTLFLNGNLAITTGGSTSDFIEIGRINGWRAVDRTYVEVPPQNGDACVLTVYTTWDGIIRMYGSNLTNGFYRFHICIPS